MRHCAVNQARNYKVLNPQILHLTQVEDWLHHSGETNKNFFLSVTEHTAYRQKDSTYSLCLRAEQKLAE